MVQQASLDGLVNGFSIEYFTGEGDVDAWVDSDGCRRFVAIHYLTHVSLQIGPEHRPAYWATWALPGCKAARARVRAEVAAALGVTL